MKLGNTVRNMSVRIDGSGSENLQTNTEFSVVLSGIFIIVPILDTQNICSSCVCSRIIERSSWLI